MKHVWNGTLSDRVNYAAKRLLTVKPHNNLSTRSFDSCFEMGDGDAVVAALVRRAQKNPKLWAAIAQQWGGTFPQSWLDTAAKQKAA